MRLICLNEIFFQPKKNPTAHLTPASIVPQKQITSQPTQDNVQEIPKSRSRECYHSFNRSIIHSFDLETPVVRSKDIWNIDEVPANDTEITDEVDKRPQPE